MTLPRDGDMIPCSLQSKLYEKKCRGWKNRSVDSRGWEKERLTVEDEKKERLTADEG